jgi:P-type E1-E2 ATPase
LLDKTATLTVGAPVVTDFEAFGEADKLLRVAISIEEKSNHPIAECVKAFALSKVENEGVIARNYSYQMGKGAVAEVEGETYRLGNRKLVPNMLLSQAEMIEKRYSEQGKTVVFLTTDQEIKAVFAIADTLKETSEQAIRELKKRGVRTAMITGDIENVAKAISEKVGIDEYFAEALPEDKAKSVQRVRSVGGFVAMVGDGINDSPALKEADVGIAMGTGTDVAIDSADVVLVSGDLRSLSTMIDLSKATVRNIKQNLFWAFFYNCVAIPVAAGVLAFANIGLNPMIAAACMSLSSLFVVTNAIRLTRFGKKRNNEKEEELKMEKVLKVEGMMCQHCVAHVTKALQAVEGVSNVTVDLKKKTAVVTLANVVNNETLVEAVVQAGYEVKKIS